VVNDDIVTRLRDVVGHMTSRESEIEWEAADEIEHLRAESSRWKRLFIELYPKNNGVTDEMMWTYRNETGKK